MKTTFARMISRSAYGAAGFLVFLPAAFLYGATSAYANTGTVSITNVSPSTMTVVVGSPITFTVTTSGFNGPSYYLADSFIGGSLGNYDLTSVGTSATFSWTPAPNDVGSHNVTITVTDSSGDSGSASVTLTVESAAQAAAAAQTTVSTPVVTTPVVTTPAVTTVETPVTTTPAVPATTFTENLTSGMSDSQVTALQQVLTAQGDFTGTVTGYYGALTKAAVIKFQAANNIPQLGIVGPATRAALNALSSSTTTQTTVTPATTSTTVTPTTTANITEIQTEVQSLSTQLSQIETQLSQLVGN